MIEMLYHSLEVLAFMNNPDGHVCEHPAEPRDNEAAGEGDSDVELEVEGQGQGQGEE